MPNRLSALLALVFTASLAQAQDPMWGLRTSALFGQDWLGSEDTRRGGYYALTYSKREPRFHFWGYDAEMDLEAHYMVTKGGADFIAGPNTSHHYGLLLIGRYYQKYAKSSRAFLEGGWGLQYTNRLTHDLDSMWNSTPMLGGGIVVPFPDWELMLSVRYFHISNAGTAGDNEGLNFFQFTVGARF